MADPAEKKPLTLITQEDSWLADVDNNIIDILTDALEKAKKGEYNGLAMVMTHKDGSTESNISSRADSVRMTGAVSRLLWRMQYIDLVED